MEETHEELRKLIQNTKMKTLICERSRLVYDKLKSPWCITDMGELPNATPDGVTEYIWTNFEIPLDIKAVAQKASWKRISNPKSRLFGEGLPDPSVLDEQ